MRRHPSDLFSRAFRHGVRVSLTGVTLMAMVAATMISVQATPAAAAAPPVTADGSITCFGVSGAAKFSTALKLGGTSPASAAAKLTLSNCVQSGTTNVASTVFAGSVALTMTLANNDCASLAGAWSQAASVVWKGLSPVQKINPTTETGSGAIAADDDSGHAGLSVTGTSTGSYAGSSAGTIYTNTTQTAVITACSSTAGLKSLTFASGMIRFGTPPPPPVFTSASSTSFTEGVAGTFTVAASDITSLRYKWAGATLPPGVRFVSNRDNATATLSGTPRIGSAGVYTLHLSAQDHNAQSAQQTFTLTVLVSPTRPVVTIISPAAGAGGASVTITGLHFTGATSVKFGTTAASYTVNNDTTITATAPTLGVGQYDVTVTSASGTSPVVYDDLFEYDVPPQRPAIVGVTAEGLSIEASWAPNATSDLVTGYTLTASVAAGYTGSVPGGCNTPPTTSALATDTAGVLTGVCAGVPYTVTVTATNAYGNSSASGASNPVVPMGAQAPSQPLITNVFSRPGSLEVHWVAPSQLGGDPLTTYTLVATPKTGAPLTLHPSSSATTATITGLTDGTAYTVSLQAGSAAGMSVANSTAAAPSSKAKPTPPAGLMVVPDGSGNLVATWSPPTDTGSQPLTGYAGVATPADVAGTVVPNGSVKVILPPVTTSWPIIGLSPTTSYKVSIVAFSAVGKSKPIVTSTAVSPTVELASNAAILSQSTMNLLLSDSAGTLRFPPSPPADVVSLTPGETIVGPTSTAAPEGIVATVQSVYTDGAGRYVVDTAPASMTDAFKTLSYSVVGVPPGGANMTLRGKVPGIRSTSSAAGSAVPAFSVDYDLGPVKINGQVTVTPDVGLSASFSCGFLCLSPSLQAEAHASLSASEQFTATLATDDVKKINILSADLGCICFSVGPIPIVIIPKINVDLDMTGHVKLTEAASVSIGGEVGWSSSGGFHSSSFHTAGTPGGAPLLSVQGSGLITLAVQPALCFYDIICANVEADGTLTATLSTTSTPYFKICPSISVAVGFELDLLFWSYSNSTNIWSSSYNNCAVETNKPPVILTITPTNPVVAGPGVQQFTPSWSDGLTYPLTWNLLGAQLNDSISATGLLSTSAPAGGRTFSVIAKDSHGLSATATVTVGTAPLFDPPGNLTFTPSSSYVTASWTAPVHTGGSSLVGYVVVVRGSVQTMWFARAPFEYVLFTPNLSVQIPTARFFTTWYTVSVYALNSGGVASQPAYDGFVVG